MLSDNINIDDVFREHLSDYDYSAPVDTWDEIEHRLITRRKKVHQKYYRVAAFIIMFLLVGGLIIIQNFSFQRKQMTNLDIENSAVKSKATASSAKLNNINKKEDLITSFDVVNKQEKQTENKKDYIVKEEKEEKSSKKNVEEAKAFSPQLDKLSPLFTRLQAGSNFNDVQLAGHYTTNQNSEFFSRELRKSTLANTYNKKPERIEFGGNLSPTITYRTTSGKNNSVSADINEKSLISYSGGFNFGYKFSNRLKISSGVYYSQFGQSMDNIGVTRDSYVSGDRSTVYINSSFGTNELTVSEIYDAPKEPYTDVELPLSPSAPNQINDVSYDEFIVESTLFQKMEFIKIPFLIEYKLIDKSFTLSMISGMNTNVLVDQGVYLENSISENKIGRINDLQPISYSGTLGLGMDYKIQDNIHLTMQPLVDYFISSFSSNGKTFPYSFGLYTGLSVSF